MVGISVRRINNVAVINNRKLFEKVPQRILSTLTLIS